MNLLLSLMLVLCLLPLPVIADDGLQVDAQFDKTGDKLVDAADWSLMTESEQIAYARASVKALGEDPDMLLQGGKSRTESYLDGLKAVYDKP